MSGNGKVTIYDLAQQLHTTASTVSRALQDNPRISAKMREAVQKLAKELHYIPDPIAHHLRTGKGNAFGIIVPRIDRNFFAAIISAFQQVASKYNYQVIIAASGESKAEEENALRALIQKKVDGIAMSLSLESAGTDYESVLEGQNIPLVYFDRIPANTQTDTVTNDNYQVGYDAVVQLHKLGCKKIGHFAGSLNQLSYAERYRGYSDALKDLGLEERSEWLFKNTITIDAGNDAAQKIIQMTDRPDGIFSSGDFPAIKALDIFRKKGLKVPDDIAIIGVANEPLDSFLATPLSSFNLHQQRIGEMAAKILLSRINELKEDEFTHPTHMIVSHELILRESSI